LRQVLLSLDVQGAAPPAKKKIPARKTPTRGKKTPVSAATSSARNSTRSSTRAAARKRTSPGSDDEHVSHKSRRVIAIGDDKDEDADFLDSKPSASINSDYETAREDETESMDWEIINDADDEQNTGPKIGIKVLFTEGPHAGESLSLIKNGTETVILGSRPNAKNAEAFVLAGDEEVDETHLKIDLDANKKIQAVVVTNLSSSRDAYVNGTAIAFKMSRKVFISDTIKIGDSTMKVQTLATNEKRAATKKPAATATASRMQVDQHDEEENVSPPTKNKARSTGPGVCILVTEGPCKNTSFALTKNETPVLVIGSNPTSKSEETFLIQDPSIAANHVRLELIVARKLCTVNVKDLKSSGGTLVNSTNVKAGKVQKAFINDSIHIGDTVLQVKTL
jgi:hypothetical protein